MHAPAIGSAIHLVFFDSHRLTNQNDFAAVCPARDADIVLYIIRPALKEISQTQDFHDESPYLTFFSGNGRAKFSKKVKNLQKRPRIARISRVKSHRRLGCAANTGRLTSLHDGLECMPGSRAFRRYPERGWRFKNTRVPVKALFENLESGATVDQFLDWFPGVNREQVLAVLAFAEESLAVT